MTRTATQRLTWDSHSIRAEISRRGYTLSGLAAEAGLAASTCRLSLVRPSPSGDQVIAELLGVSLHELWPDRYDARGHRLMAIRHRIRPRPKRRKKRAPA